jgi:WD40 repeat protein
MKKVINLPSEKPEIYSIRKSKKGISFSRKEFIGVLSAIGVGAALTPYDHNDEKIENTGAIVSGFIAHSTAVLSANYSPDGKILASGSQNGEIKLWTLPEAKLLSLFKEHSSAVYSTNFSQDGKMLVSGSIDKTIKIWSVINKKLGDSLKSNINAINTVCFNLDGTILAAGGDKITLYKAPGGGKIKTLKGRSTVNSLKFSPDGRFLISGSRDKTIKIWSTSDWRLIKTLTGHDDSVISIDISRNGKIIASGSRDKSIKLWSFTDGELLATLNGHTDYVFSVSFSPDNKLLASGSKDKTIKLWSVEDKKILNTLEGHSGPVYSVSFHPENTELVSCSDDKTIRIWKLPDGKPSYLLFDPSLIDRTSSRQIKEMGPSIFTLPCGSPIPANATCICDCVATSRTYPGTEMVCTCNTITVPIGTTLTGNMVCVCDTITVGSYQKPAETKDCSCNTVETCRCNRVCTCDTICSCNNNQAYYYVSYWYPN